MIGSIRRHLRSVLIGAVVVLVGLPPVMLALTTANAPGAPGETPGPIQELCQGPFDSHVPGQQPVLPVVVEIIDGRDSAYLLQAPAPNGLTYINVCRASNGGTLGGGYGGTVGPPLDPRLSLDTGGGIDSQYPTDRLYAGHVGPTVVRVEATLASGATVEAALANGFYLVWARTGESAVRITAFDASGAEAHRIEDADGLMPR